MDKPNNHKSDRDNNGAVGQSLGPLSGEETVAELAKLRVENRGLRDELVKWTSRYKNPPTQLEALALKERNEALAALAKAHEAARRVVTSGILCDPGACSDACGCHDLRAFAAQELKT